MKITTSLAFVVAISFVAACGSPDASGSGSSSAGAKEAKSSSKPAKEAGGGAPAGKKELALDPLPLKAHVDPSSKGVMDGSRDGKKSVKVDMGGGVTLNVAETTESLADVMKRAHADKTIYPFKKFEKEEGMSSVWSFEIGGKTGYRGVMMIDVGGKSYECQTTGLDGAPSADEAQKQVDLCKAIVAK